MEEVVTNKLLPLLVVVGLAAGCVAGVSSPPGDGEPLPVSSPLPTQTGESDAAPAGETPEAPSRQATPDVSPAVERQLPPAVETLSPSTPVEAARSDLARRLHVDAFWIEVVEVVVREPDTVVMPCLAEDAAFEKLGEGLDEVRVQWISLSVKGSVHHYVALGDLVVYCGE